MAFMVTEFPEHNTVPLAAVIEEIGSGLTNMFTICVLTQAFAVRVIEYGTNTAFWVVSISVSLIIELPLLAEFEIPN